MNRFAKNILLVGACSFLLQGACENKSGKDQPELPKALLTSTSEGKAPESVVEPPRPVASAEISWIEDNADQAFKKAKEEKKPLFVDLWAPWCHTCIAMRGHILLGKNFEELKDRFVFLAIDTEKEVNATFLQKYPVGVWPTFYVIDPDSGALAGRWLGAGSVQQIRGFLKDGERAVEQNRAGSFAADDPIELMLAGDREAAQKNYPEAAQKYLEALDVGVSDWSRRPDVLVSAITALWKGKDLSGCADLALASLAPVSKDDIAKRQNNSNTSTVTDFAAFALECADALPKEDVRIEKVRRAVEARLSTLADDATSLLSVDDRSDAYANLQGVRESLGDTAGAQAAAEKRIAVLEAGMKGETDEIAVAYDWSLADAYLYVGRSDDALKLLKQRELALPKNYNPPHYLARTYHKLKKEDAALASIDKAIALAYGPRKANMMNLKADILEALNKPADAKTAIEEQLKLYQALPEGQKLPEKEADAIARIKKLSK
jgi:thiol-disulfide isomerase/thioredoxin